MDRKRKGQIEINFNWIFILVAGAAILIFFIVIASKQDRGNEEQTAGIVSAKLQTLFSAVQQNPDAVQVQDNINAELEFSCTEEGHFFTIKGGNSKAYLNSEILFSPKRIDGKSGTAAWTKVYSSPYPVVQILYFTDESTYYLFVDQPVREYYNRFPEQFGKKFLSQSELQGFTDEGFKKYIIVTTQSAGSLPLDSAVERKSTIVRIGSDRVEFVYGGEYDSARSVPYVNEATLFGAIVSGDHELYGCVMEKIMTSSKIVGEINLERAILLEETDNEKCMLFLASGIAREDIRSIISLSVYSEGEDYSSLRESITSLQNFNTQMARSNCPTIY